MAPPANGGGISIPTTDAPMSNGGPADDPTWNNDARSPAPRGGDPPRRSSRSRSPGRPADRCDDVHFNVPAVTCGADRLVWLVEEMEARTPATTSTFLA